MRKESKFILSTEQPIFLSRLHRKPILYCFVKSNLSFNMFKSCHSIQSIPILDNINRLVDRLLSSRVSLPRFILQDLHHLCFSSRLLRGLYRGADLTSAYGFWIEAFQVLSTYPQMYTVGLMQILENSISKSQDIVI